jgi:hypothetical protein
VGYTWEGELVYLAWSVNVDGVLRCAEKSVHFRCLFDILFSGKHHIARLVLCAPKRKGSTAWHTRECAA